MAFQAYASFKGKTQGQLKGESQKTGRSDKWTEVLSFKMESGVPVDSKSGSPKGARGHQPIVITKEVGASSPQLLQAHWANEVFTEVVIENKHGVHVYQRITLTNALISHLIRFSATAAREASRRNTQGLEKISFTYGKITVENVAGSTSTSDDWTAQT